MAVRGQDIASVIRSQIENWEQQLEAVNEGTVIEVGDGVAQVHGLSGAAYTELLEFEGGVMGMALNLEEDSVGAVIMGDPLAVKEGSRVRSTGRIVEVPVGENILSRVVSALGEPIDGKGPIDTSETKPVEVVAPDVSTRISVDTPVQTGIKAIDAMIPIGRGQRELIIGDRSTGKSAIALDTIINQRGGDLVYLRCHRSEGEQGGADGRAARKPRRDGAHDSGRGELRRPRADAVPSSLTRAARWPSSSWTRAGTRS